MSEVDLIVQALEAGAAAGATGVATNAVQKAYATLLDRLGNLFSRHDPSAGDAAAFHRTFTADELLAHEAHLDEEVVAAARALRDAENSQSRGFRNYGAIYDNDVVSLGGPVTITINHAAQDMAGE